MLTAHNRHCNERLCAKRPNPIKTMAKIKLKNIFWIALLAVWSFLAGAYFHLGWIRDRSFNFQAGFILGGIAM